MPARHRAASASATGNAPPESQGGGGPIRLLVKAEEAQLVAALRDLLDRHIAVEVALEWPENGAQSELRKPRAGDRSRVRRLPVRSARGSILYVPVERIDWIAATNQYVRLHAEGRHHLVRISMTELEGTLDPDQFCRIHRSSIVNLERVREVHTDSRTERWVLLADGTRLQVSQSHWPRLQDALVGLA